MSSISSSKVISPTAYARKEYAFLQLSGNQTTDVAANDPVKFNTIVMNNMEFAPSTYRVTLKANKLYCVSSALYILCSANTGYAQYRIYDVTNATFIGMSGTAIVSSYTAHQGTQENIEHYIKPLTDIVIEIRLSSVNSLDTIYAIGSYLKIQEIETFSPMVQTYQYAYVSPEMDLQVSLADWTTNYAKVIFYKTSNGIWHMRFNLKGVMVGASRTGITLAVAGVNFDEPTNYSQFVAGGTSSVTSRYTVASSNSFVWVYASNTTTTHWASGDIKLYAKPTGYGLPSDI